MHRLLAGLLLLAAGPACAGNDHVRSILAGSGFEGTALVGEPDGSSEMLVFAGSTPLQAGDIWRWASITLPSAVMWGNRLKRWNTIPTLARCRAISLSGSR